MIVDTILQTKGTTVHTVHQGNTLGEAVALLNRHNIGSVVVTDAGGAIAGIVSERDVVRQLATDPAAALARTVGSCMSRTVITCERSTAIAKVMEHMTNHRIRHMPVVEQGRLAGIISIGDVVKLKIEEVEHEAEALRDYIAS